ncbi:MAG: carboxypeptidase-like regulatory domain-containing protein [Myxococcales bacterium]
MFAGLGLSLLLGCSATSVSQPSGTGASDAGGSASSSGSPSFGGDLNVGNDLHRACKGLSCLKVDCPADSSPSTTSVSGVVYDPAGRVPLYNAVVYVVDPATMLKPLSQRAQCEACAAHFPESATAVTLTNANGSFRLTDMPAGKNVPLIIQLGKWRRVVTIPMVAPCSDTRLPADLTRLPRNSSEGDLPKIAVTTGGSDALECLLKKIGVDVDEFTPDSGNGRVNLYAGYRASNTINVGGKSQPLRPAEELWASSDRMLDYDMILMGCEGEGSLWKTPDEVVPTDPPPLPRPAAMQLEVRKYADLGGRIFGSHWHHRWINSDDTTPDAPYPPSGPPVATFSRSSGGVDDLTVSVDASFPKGLAFRDWLVNVNASTTPGSLDLRKLEHSVDSVDPTLARRWIYGVDPGGKVGGTRVPDMVQYFSFTTPVGAPECGRMVFSDLHVSFGGGDDAATPFPDRCNASPDGELSPQEKALEFMIFDLSSCIQKEDDQVSSPITVVK